MVNIDDQVNGRKGVVEQEDIHQTTSMCNKTKSFSNLPRMCIFQKQRHHLSIKWFLFSLMFNRLLLNGRKQQAIKRINSNGEMSPTYMQTIKQRQKTWWGRCNLYKWQINVSWPQQPSCKWLLNFSRRWHLVVTAKESVKRGNLV